jgi:hypothetical protein
LGARAAASAEQAAAAGSSGEALDLLKKGTSGSYGVSALEPHLRARLGILRRGLKERSKDEVEEKSRRDVAEAAENNAREQVDMKQNCKEAEKNAEEAKGEENPAVAAQAEQETAPAPLKFDGKEVFQQQYNITADSLCEILSARNDAPGSRGKRRRKTAAAVAARAAAAELIGEEIAPHATNQEHEPHWLASQCAKVGLPGFGHAEVIFPPQTVSGETTVSFSLPALADPHPSRFNDPRERHAAAMEWITRNAAKHGKPDSSCLGGDKHTGLAEILVNSAPDDAELNNVYDEGLQQAGEEEDAFQVGWAVTGLTDEPFVHNDHYTDNDHDGDDEDKEVNNITWCASDF